MSKTVLSPAALRDIRNILVWSKDKFGVEAARRYRVLMMQVLRDVTDAPERQGSKERPEIMALGVRTYHLAGIEFLVRLSRNLGTLWFIAVERMAGCR